MNLFLATNSKVKLNEIKMGINSFEVFSNKRFNTVNIDPEYKGPVEVATSYLENCIHKAKSGMIHSGMLTLAEDGGIILPILKDKLGVYTADYIESFGFLPNGDRDHLTATKAILATGMEAGYGDSIGTVVMPAKFISYTVVVHPDQPDVYHVGCGTLTGSFTKPRVWDNEIYNSLAHFFKLSNGFYLNELESNNAFMLGTHRVKGTHNALVSWLNCGN